MRMKQAITNDFFAKVQMLSWVNKHQQDIYFIGSQANLEKNNYEKNIYRLKDGVVRQMTRGQIIHSYECHQDGLRYLQKVADEGLWNCSTAIYELPYDGGEAIEILRLPYAIEEMQWIDDDHFFFTASIHLKYQRLLSQGMSSEEASQKMAKDLAQCREFVEVPFWMNGVGDVSEVRTKLFYYNQGNIACLSDNQGNVHIEALACQRRLYYTFQEIDNGLMTKGNSLYSYDLETQKHKKHSLFNTQVSYRSVTMINDHEAFLTVDLSEEYGDNENSQCFIWQLEDDHVRKIYDGDRYHLGNSVGSDIKMGNRSSFPLFDEEGIYVIVTDEHHAPLMRIGYDGQCTMITKDNPMIQEVIADDDGFIVIAMVQQSFNEIYHLDKQGHLQALSKINTHLTEDYHIFQPQVVQFKNENGLNLTGWVILPQNYQANGSTPAILDIHGGPKTVFGPHFFHEMQWFAAKGYAVMFTNPTGSDGLGNAFADISGKYGTVDYRDLMTFVDVVIEQYPGIDENRLGVTGGSYGGFMTNWIIGHTHRFKAAVSQRSIASWAIFENTSDIGWSFGPDQTKGNQWENHQLLWDQSPIQFAPQVKTPTLFIHSDEDTRCWMAEGISMFYALKRFGVESKLCLFKGENHELSRSGRPQNRIRRLEEILDWMDRYLK